MIRFCYSGKVCRLKYRGKRIFYGGFYWERLLELGSNDLRAGQHESFSQMLADWPMVKPRKPKIIEPGFHTKRFNMSGRQ